MADFDKASLVLQKLDHNGDGTIQREEFAQLLQGLDEEAFHDDTIGQLLVVADAKSDGQIDYRTFLDWVFNGGNDDAPLRRIAGQLLLEGSPAEGNENNITADLQVVWEDSDGQKHTANVADIPLACTLAELKRRCAVALSAAAVDPLDFNEDMDGRSLVELGIGIGSVPFAVALTASAKSPPESSARSIVIPRAPTVGPGAAPGCTDKSKPLAERQALQDTTDVKDGWLFLGGQIAAGNRASLQSVGVTHVLNCCERIPCKFRKVLEYKVLSLTDTQRSDIRPFLAEGLEFIDAAHANGGGCLVHCMVGASRSTSFVLAWLVSRCKMPLREAFKGVRAARSVARPNRTFCLQLMEYETEILGACSATLQDFGHK